MKATDIIAAASLIWLLVSHNVEFPGGELKRWRDVPVFLRI